MKFSFPLKSIKTHVENKFGIYKIMKEPENLKKHGTSDLLSIPSNIIRPEYAIPKFKHPIKTPNNIIIKSEETIKAIKEVSQIAKKALKLCETLCKPGISTGGIDQQVKKFIFGFDAYPSPLGYYEYPKSLCTSINNVICHGIPDLDTILIEGDIINCDITVFKNGVHGDTSKTFLVGNVDPKGRELSLVTEEALLKGIESIKPGLPLNIIGKTIQDFVDHFGFSLCDEFTGHGIGQWFHELPLIHHGYNNDVTILKPGMVFTIEPMVCQGTAECTIWNDNWTAVTKDDGRSAQFEHTILVTDKGYEILT